MPGTLHEHLLRARRALEAAGIPTTDAAIDADVLARHVLGWSLATLLTRSGEPPPGGFAAAFDAAIARRAAREPVAYITGHREFWGREFHVTRDVLIPRPETEIIVETVLLTVGAAFAGRILDVGTGSGCLAVTLLAERPRARALATDISTAALQVAGGNAGRHGVAERLWRSRMNGLDGATGPFDVIVSNPPYVPDGTSVQPDVAGYEPHGALFAGPDGLDVLRALVPAARARLAAGGLFVVEFGVGQEAEVASLAGAAGWALEIRRDLQGIPRTAVMR